MTQQLPYITQQVRPENRSKAFWVVSDAWVLINRSLKHIFKDKDQLIGLTMQPIMFMILFRYVFGGAIQTEGTSYVNFLIAGILVQSLAFGSLTTSISVASDLQRGIVDRIKSLPIASWTLLMGHVAADLVRNVIQSIILIAAGLLVGFRPEASVSDWLVIAGIVLLFTFAMSWVAAVMGLVGKSVETVQTYGFFFIFPLTFASAAFAPTESMPKILRVFAENQPVTHVIEAIRALMIGTPIGNHGTIAALWCVGAIIVSIPVANYLFRRHSGR
jgi:ABC-2 type transport system permease protein